MPTATGDFPINPEQLTPDWLTSALRESIDIGSARVTSMKIERVGEGVGFLGQLARVTPTYDRAPASAPRAFVAKFPSSDEATRQLAGMYGLYRSEVNFYAKIAGALPLRTPRCYHAAMNPEATEFVLLLEDLSAAGRLGDQMAGCTLDDARLALRELARFHASCHGAAIAERCEWMPRGVDLGRLSLGLAYPVGWQACVDGYSALLTPELRAAAPTLNERLLKAFDRFEEAPQTIMHGDYRLDNLFFGNPGSGYELAVIDWQLVNRGWCTYDAAYFMGSNLDIDVRRQHEMALLDEYHRTLGEAGMQYSFEQCRDDYVLSMLGYLANMIGNIASIDTTNARGVALFELIFTRVVAAVTDLHALDLLD